MNYEACESFIDFCDDMMIGVATEGKIKDAYNKFITVDPKKAINASSIDQVKTMTNAGYSLIRLKGALKGQIENYLKSAKSDAKKLYAATAGSLAVDVATLALVPIAPAKVLAGILYGTAATSIAHTVHYTTKHGSLAAYRIAKGSDGNLYLIEKHRKLANEN